MKLEEWRDRIARRTDLSEFLCHFIKYKENNDPFGTLISILRDKRLIGSEKKGYINGDIPAVCLQDGTLTSMCQAIYYQKEKNENRAKNFSPVGIIFAKQFIYKKGGRPVIYDKTEEAKNYLNQDHYWRIVDFDLSNPENIIDWTHEREWRVPNNLEFEYNEIYIAVPYGEDKKNLEKKLKNEGMENILDKIKGIVELGLILR